MRNTFLYEDECKKKMEWLGGSTNQQRDPHPREKRKRLGFSLKEKEKEKYGKSDFLGPARRTRWASDTTRWASSLVFRKVKFDPTTS